ncbi:MAG: hypothetical protein JWP12_3517 [Bacteroidetes bacterium]|nr:hypothetical protein [Bacteroidota bacterium]
MDELAKLIGSLTKAEKRYFKMFTSLQSGEKGYLKLFEAIEKSDNYDEEKIKKMFAGEDFIKRLPAVKNYLYNQILKSLRIIYSGNTVESELREMMEDVSNLYEKRLYKQCAKILDKAKELANKNEFFLQLIEINSWKERILIELLTLDKYEAIIDKHLEEEIDLIESQKNIARYRSLYNKMILINRKIKEARSEEELKQFQTIIEHPLLKSIDTAYTFEAKNYFYRIHLIYNHAKGDNEASFVIADSQLKLIESYPEKIKEKPQLYITALNNVLLCEIHIHKYDNFKETLLKLRNFPLKSLSTEVGRFVTSYTFEMVMYLDSGEFHKSSAIREEISEGLTKYHDKINAVEEITMLYNLFYSYFGTAEYSKALGIINRLLNEYQKELRYDIQCAVRILNLILHYELGNTRLIEYNAFSTYRFLYKSKRLYKLENIVLNFIRKKMPSIYTAKEQIEAFKELRQEFIAISEHPYEKKAFEYFDYISWLDSKIENKPLEEIVKKKFKTVVSK